MIKLVNITKIFGNINAESCIVTLNNISMEISKNSYSAIMGPSGSGKTTLLNILGCLDTPTEGQFEFNEKDVLTLSENELAKMRNKSIGFVFQHFHLLPRLTALENIELPLIYSGIPVKKRRKLAEEALLRVGLENKARNLPHELSGGQKQRVAIARSIINKPDLILADEPTGALDTTSSEIIMNIFSGLYKEGATIILITHDRNVAMNAKSIIHLLDGKINKVERVVTGNGTI